MIAWLDKESFAAEIGKTFNSKVHDLPFCSFDIARATLEDVIPAPPDIVLNPEPFTEPGPYLSWFGRSAGHHFLLTCYLSEFSSTSDCLVAVITSEPCEFDWQLFRKLDFPNIVVSHLSWISGYLETDFSLYSKDKDELQFELYRAANEEDANQLRSYLIERGFQNHLRIGTSEPLVDWVVKKGVEIIARYTSRHTAESFALRRSGIEDSQLVVSAPSLPNSPQSVFASGRKQK